MLQEPARGARSRPSLRGRARNDNEKLLAHPRKISRAGRPRPSRSSKARQRPGADTHHPHTERSIRFRNGDGPDMRQLESGAASRLDPQIQKSCEHNQMPYTADVYALASIGDKQAIPALHKLATGRPTKTGRVCQAWVRAGRLALAKLGNDDYAPGCNAGHRLYRRRSGTDGID